MVTLERLAVDQMAMLVKWAVVQMVTIEQLVVGRKERRQAVLLDRTVMLLEQAVLLDRMVMLLEQVASFDRNQSDQKLV
jgi:hypothetical protein